VKSLIPTEEEKQSYIKKAEALIKLPKGWKIELEVKPWLDCDLMYEIERGANKVVITAYSAWFPSTFNQWIDALADQVNPKLEKDRIAAQ
jgi:hypothetical protein